MNERIKELEKQANEYADGLGLSGDEWCDVQAKRFTELIVRECANIAAKNQTEDMDWDIGEIIKEHFGVEE